MEAFFDKLRRTLGYVLRQAQDNGWVRPLTSSGRTVECILRQVQDERSMHVIRIDDAQTQEKRGIASLANWARQTEQAIDCCSGW